MYTRLTEQETCEVRKNASKISTYKITFRAISNISRRLNDITPAEAWNEAEKVISELAQSDHINFSIEDIAENLLHRYREFISPGPVIITRTEQETETTRLLVLFNVMVMLAQREKNSENHPYIEYCRKIANIIRPHALYLEMCDMLKENEESLEEDIGYELEPVDFLNGNAILQSIKDNETVPPSFDDDEYRRDKLKSIYKKLKQEKEFSGGSQWFYIYKMMAENSIYNEHSYTPFIKDLKTIGVNDKSLPPPIIFSRKYKQIKEGTLFPHWKVKTGGKQPTLDLGIKLAKIAFQILFP